MCVCVVCVYVMTAVRSAAFITCSVETAAHLLLEVSLFNGTWSSSSSHPKCVCARVCEWLTCSLLCVYHLQTPRVSVCDSKRGGGGGGFLNNPMRTSVPQSALCRDPHPALHASSLQRIMICVKMVRVSAECGRAALRHHEQTHPLSHDMYVYEVIYAPLSDSVLLSG